MRSVNSARASARFARCVVEGLSSSSNDSRRYNRTRKARRSSVQAHHHLTSTLAHDVMNDEGKNMYGSTLPPPNYQNCGQVPRIQPWHFDHPQ